MRTASELRKIRNRVGDPRTLPARVWGRLFHAPPFDHATPTDVANCYRLLLQRQASDEELAYWDEQLKTGYHTVASLVDEFFSSTEFLQLQETWTKEKLVDLGQFKLFVRPHDFSVGAAIWHTKTHEPHVTRVISELLEPGASFLDIGANIGYFTMMAAALVGETGTVTAFEPNPENCEAMRRSIQTNGFTNIELHQLACAEREQTFTLDTAGTGSNGRVIDDSPEAVPGSTPPRPVQAVVLDDFLEDRPIDLVKIDIEGAEPRAIAGMQGMIRAYHPKIVTEFSPALIQVTSHIEPSEYLTQLEELGYRFELLAGDLTAASAEEVMIAVTDRDHVDLLATHA